MALLIFLVVLLTGEHQNNHLWLQFVVVVVVVVAVAVGLD